MQLKRENLKDQVLAVLRQELITGQLRPGQIHSAAAVANRLGTSNAPVREAMQAMVFLGAMEVVPNRGFKVVSLDKRELDDIIELRCMIEIPAMEKIAAGTVATDGLEWADEIRATGHRCADAAAAGDLVQFLELDRAFHLGILERLGNARLVDMVGTLRDQTRLYGMPQLAQDGELTESAQEHLDILDAVVAGDAALTGRLMTRHLGHVLNEWADPENT